MGDALMWDRMVGVTLAGWWSIATLRVRVNDGNERAQASRGTTPIITFCKSIDTAMGGGFRRGEVTEIRECADGGNPHHDAEEEEEEEE
jgi:hypothetical protein